MSTQRNPLAEVDPNISGAWVPTSAQPCKRQRLASPSPSPSPPAHIDSAALLSAEFDAWIDALPPSMIGSLGGNGTELKMPMRSDDGRALTWKKWVNEVTSKVKQSKKDPNRKRI